MTITVMDFHPIYCCQDTGILIFDSLEIKILLFDTVFDMILGKKWQIFNTR